MIEVAIQSSQSARGVNSFRTVATHDSAGKTLMFLSRASYAIADFAVLSWFHAVQNAFSHETISLGD